MSGLVIDLFAGGGGASTGIEAALGRSVDLAVNHSAIAIAVHEGNHRGTRHLTSDVYEVDPVQATRGEPVELLWASPDCTHFSRAKGKRPDRPRSRKIRALAWVVVRWARAVRPRVICMENVLEFLTWGPLDKNGQPVATRIGRTFREWVRALTRLGYAIEWKELDASRYGAPTRRKRLFIVARCDGEPIRWPAPTHGPGLLPFRTAGDCIDWTIPTRSIFGRKRPLAEKTMHRIAEGIRRFVLENPRPYIVKFRGEAHSSDTLAPPPTITAKGAALGLAVPMLTKFHSGAPSKSARNASPEEPLRTLDTSNRFGLAMPVLVGVGGRAGQSPPTGGDEPVGTITAKNDRAVLVPYLVNTRNGEREGQAPRVRSIEEPTPTVTAKGSQGAIAEVALVDMQRDNAPRALDEPLGTLTTQGNRFNLLRAAFVARHYGGMVGESVEKPLPTVTARDHHSPVAAALIKFRGTCNGASLDEPMPTITSQGMHLAECRAFLKRYEAKRPKKAATLFEDEREPGTVLVDGVEYEIGDVFLRMLEPDELLRAQFGEHAAGYDLSPATTKEAKTRLIGNSVCPHVAAALVRANVRESLVAEAAS